jgi:hypothetical protein
MKRISSDPISFVSFDPLIGSSYYRALPTTTTQWDDPAGIDLFAFRQPRNWLVEVVLVRECMPLQGGEDVSPPPADPCAWRHAWYHGVQSDDTITHPFEEVDPD